MSARQDILDEFTVDEHGMIIHSLGKFEGEMVYAPYFCNAASDGEELSFLEDGCGEYVSLVEISDDDRKEFPELDAAAKYIGVVETEQGFVSCTQLTEEQADAWRADYEEEEESSFGCDSCEALMINGVFCHETGCPNQHKVWDEDEECWVNPEQDEEDE